MLPSMFVATTAWMANAPLRNHHLCAHAASPATPMMSAEAAAKAAWLSRNTPSWSPPGGFVGSVAQTAPAWGQAQAYVPPPNLVHAPIAHFALDKLAPKGTRRSQGGLVDVGEPADFSRPLALDADGKAISWCEARVGSWACTEGGWDSPKLRPTTESFLVLDGAGRVCDADGTEHPFGPGDVVVLPKHWHGRWDIYQTIHKLWVVHDHPDVPGAADGVVRAVVAPVPDASHAMHAPPLVEGALRQAPAHVAHTIYNVGPTRVGFLSCQHGKFAVAERPTAEIFFVTAGVFYLTNADGSARRCVAGDTVVLPRGWAGHWDIIEPVTKVWVEVE